MGGCMSTNPRGSSGIVCHPSKLKPTPSFYFGKLITIEELNNLLSQGILPDELNFSHWKTK
jgi:hypothetical protein